MDLSDILSSELPAPRDDEPSGLRQDILDELADHLACSYNRELLRGADAAEARRRAIERFGDPAAVVRRLWLDAMKGKIMLQRTVIATCLIVALASLSAVALIWRQSALAQRDSARLTVEAMRVMAAQDEKARAAEQEMIHQLREMTETIRRTGSLDWNPVKFQVKEGSAEGPPVKDVTITLSGLHDNGQPKRDVSEVGNRVTDEKGRADFGVVRPGVYQYHVGRSWKGGIAYSDGTFRVEPGSQIAMQIVCPKAPLPRVPVHIRLNWPEDLARENLAFHASFTLDSPEAGGLTWKIEEEGPSDPADYPRRPTKWRPLTRSVLLGPGPAMALRGLTEPLDRMCFWWADRPAQLLNAAILHGDLHEVKDPSAGFEVEEGRYTMDNLLILRPLADRGAAAGKDRFRVVLAGCVGQAGYNIWSGPPDDAEKAAAANDALDGTRMPSASGTSFDPYQDEFLYDLRVFRNWDDLSFSASPGRVNEWTITLPQAMVHAVRERLKTPRNPPKPNRLE